MPASDIIIIDDSDEEVKPTASTSKPKPAAKRKSNVVASSDSDSDGDSKSQEKKKSAVAKVGTKQPAKSSKKPPAKKAKKSKDDHDDDDDDDKPEKAKWVFKPTTGPANPDAFEEPDGKENCLEGLTFVFTGELTTMSREQGSDLVKKYGGRVTSAPSGKTSYVVVGSDAGPKKLEMIKAKKIKTLDEAQFLQLINQRPAGEADEKFMAKKVEEEKKIVSEAKKMLSKDAPEHLTELWTSKYAPTAVGQICGNKGQVTKLGDWLDAWSASARCNFKKPGKDLTGSFRAILISGPPGIGKTTAAHLIAKLAGYSILELNASDTRSKKLLESAFSDTINNTTLDGFFKGDLGTSDDVACPTITKKSIIIMDEVDGMSSGDRGGVGALNALIKKTKVPIIAICNDKSNPKMKPLMSTCFQMVFRRPSASEIRSRMMTIAYKEGIKVDAKALDQLVAGSQSDIRQIVNMLSTWKLSDKTLDFDAGKAFAKANEKNQIQTPWTLYGKLFGPQAFSSVSGMTFNDKMDLYFNDFSMMPLFVQDNYLKANFSKSTNSTSSVERALADMELAANAAESISDGDLCDQMIHGGMHWSLLPVHGVLSCITPGYYCHGSGQRPDIPSTGGFGGPAFPAWFGKNSTQNKMKRLLGEIQIRMRLRVSGDRKEIRQSYIPTLFAKIVVPLQERGVDAIDEVIAIMDEYFLTKEDWDALVEMGVGKAYREEGVLKLIPTTVKSAFTRKFNKISHPIPFYKDAGKISKKLPGGPAPDQEDVLLDDDDAVSDDEAANDDDADGGIGKDKLIKQKIKKAPAKPRAKKPKAEDSD